MSQVPYASARPAVPHEPLHSIQGPHDALSQGPSVPPGGDQAPPRSTIESGAQKLTGGPESSGMSPEEALMRPDDEIARRTKNTTEHSSTAGTGVTGRTVNELKDVVGGRVSDTGPNAAGGTEGMRVMGTAGTQYAAPGGTNIASASQDRRIGNERHGPPAETERKPLIQRLDDKVLDNGFFPGTGAGERAAARLPQDRPANW